MFVHNRLECTPAWYGICTISPSALRMAKSSHSECKRIKTHLQQSQAVKNIKKKWFFNAYIKHF